MEKRTFLAILLSLLILFVYQGVFLKKSIPVKSSLETQNIENKYVIEEINKNKPLLPSPSSVTESQNFGDVKEIITKVETNVFAAEFSNIGGTLKSLIVKKYNEQLPVQNLGELTGYEAYPFTLSENIDNILVYSFRENDYEIKKIYDLSRLDYLINFTVQVKNLSVAQKIKSFLISPFVINSESIKLGKDDSRERGLYEYSVSINDVTTRTGNAFKFSQKNSEHKFGTVQWCAFRNRYFCSIFKPEYQTKGFQINPIGEEKLILETETDNMTIDQGQSVSFEAKIYVGPQDLADLKSYGIGLEKVIAFSRFGIMDFVSKSVINIMNFMYKIIPNWGICIILMSLLAYGATYPLTMKGMMSMRKMQTIQPKITKLREQHKNNPQKLNKEVMELYKEHGVNPFGGCLPFILQMPVFIGVYQAMWRNVSFKGSSFLWIKDLTEPDRLFIFPFELRLIGNEFNILPILMMVIMFFQQKLSAKNMTITDPNQLMQQKMMTMIFPVFLGFIFYKFASGLALYFTMFYILSTLTQWKMSKMKKAE